MKVLAIKDIVDYGNPWAVRYTRLTKRGVTQAASFLCHTPEAAKAKYRELLDVLPHQNGVYVSPYTKRRPGDIHEYLREYHKQRYIRWQLGER